VAPAKSGPKRIGQTCTGGDCGTQAQCETKKCTCFFGYTPNEGDRIDCVPFKCKTNVECVHMLYTHGAECSDGECYCAAGSYLDQSSHKCQTAVALGDKCQIHDCGPGALCLNSICECGFGRIPNLKDKITCDVMNCDKDSDCERFGPKIRCHSYAPQRAYCQCQWGSKLDPATQQCGDPIGDNPSPQNVQRPSSVQKSSSINHFLLLTIVTIVFLLFNLFITHV